MLREIAAKLGVQIDATQLAGFMGQLDSAKGGLIALGKGLLAGAVGTFINEQIHMADGLGDTAAKLGVSTDELQKFQYGVERAGGSAEAADKAIFFLNKAMGAAAEGGGGAAEAFAKMGISVKDANGNVGTAMDILPGVAEAVKNAGSQAEKTAIATKIFGKAAGEILPFLDAGAEGIAAWSAEFEEFGGGVSAEFVERSGVMVNELKKFKIATRALTSTFLSALMPAINSVVLWITKMGGKIAWLAKHTNVFQVALAILGSVLAVKFIPQLFAAAKAFSALKVQVWGASVPLLLVAAIVAGLFLIFEDLYTLVTGGDSLIGSVLDQFGEAGDKAKLITQLKDAWESVKTSLNSVKPILLDLWKKIAEGSDTWVPALAAAFTFVVKAIVAGVTAFAGLLKAAAKVADGDFSGALGEVKKSTNDIMGQEVKYMANTENGQVMTSDRVGGIFGMNQADFAKKSTLGPGHQTNNIAAQTTVTINGSGLNSVEATTAVTDGVSKGVQATITDAHHAVKTTGAAQ